MEKLDILPLSAPASFFGRDIYIAYYRYTLWTFEHKYFNRITFEQSNENYDTQTK